MALTKLFDEVSSLISRYIRVILGGILNILRKTAPPIFHITDYILLCLCDVVRLYAGRIRAMKIEECDRPSQPLVLYEFEGCPYCKVVRETLSVLDLDHIVYPCPRETLVSYGTCLHSRFRPDVKREGGVIMFPFLIDNDRNVKLYNSEDIVKYLWGTYGNKAIKPINYRLAFFGPYKKISLYIVGILRPCVDMGVLRAPSKVPKVVLELYGYESSPGVKRVREALTMLELPYRMHVLPWGSKNKREAFIKEHQSKLPQSYVRLGCVKVPFLKDPNGGGENKPVELFNSLEIVRYLHATYKTGNVPAESWLNYNTVHATTTPKTE